MGYPNTDPYFEAAERAEAAAEAERLADLDARNEAHSTSWLIEWPADRQMPVRYWHPTEGHVIDPNHALRFAREEDAAMMCKRDRISAGARPVEHMWLVASHPLADARARVEELEEIVRDLVNNETERSAMGTYPGRAEVFRKAWDRAAEAVGLDDGAEA